jgi:5'-methylthioadenosine phosphorylase
VIGGTGLESLPGFTAIASLTVPTPWGAPSSPIRILEHHDPATNTALGIGFLARHGVHHQFSPTEVPGRANIAALRKLGVRCIVAFSAAGSLAEEVKPRDFVVPDQIIDRTTARAVGGSFFGGGVVCHVPFADPYDSKVRELIVKVGREEGVLEGEGAVVHDKGTVICMEGPAFSTRAESLMYRSWGGTVINMSSIPEAKLAMEAEIAYANILMSTDYDCWHESGDVTVEMVMGNIRANSGNARRLIARVLDELCKQENRDVVEAKHLEGTRRFGVSTKPEGMGEQAKERLEWLFPGYF